MLDVSIGKFTLESLTTGMYSDARIVFREYIQNAVDALEEAISKKIIESSSMRIDILIDEQKQYISIRDNGTGIPKKQAERTLLSVGDSQKRSSKNRGFRGIGRLGGMSYCDTLVFSTSYDGEDTATIVSFDCKRLRELLIPDTEDEHDLASVLSSITNIQRVKENSGNLYISICRIVGLIFLFAVKKDIIT